VREIFENLAKAKLKKYLVQDCFFKALPLGDKRRVLLLR